ncbi:error-prone DNA polymerase [soil metagenome]
MNEDPPSGKEERTSRPADLRTPPSGPAYVELACATAFSFLRGASHPHEMVGQAWTLGHAAVGVADRNTLAGVVRAHNRAKEIWETLGIEKDEAKVRGVEPFRLCVGARLVFTDGTPDVLIYPSDREAYARLTRLLTKGGMEAGVKRGDGSSLALKDLLAFGEGQNLILMPPDLPQASALDPVLDQLMEASGGRAWMAGVRRYDAVDEARLDLCAEVATRAGAPLIAVNDAVIHEPSRKRLHDVMTCIREHVTLYEAGRRLDANTERRLKTAREMQGLFRAYPTAVGETVRFAALCDFTLDELAYQYPDEPVPPGWTAQAHLKALSWRGAHRRWPGKRRPPQAVRRQLSEELRFIEKMRYPNYFLTVHDIVAWAREQGILCQGRGSAANSVVCYALGVTAIDPIAHKLLFSRFVSDNRNEPPDIDVDFEHERRELVIQHIYQRYGRHRAAICATVIHYRPRMAIREVGKVFGLTEDVTSSLASTIWGSWGDALPPDYVRQAGHDPEDDALKEVLELANELIGFPRHLSQHVGGFVLTQRPLSEICPIVNAAMPDRTFIEWDKDDIDAVGLMKVDVLALGMLTAIMKAFGLLEREGVLPPRFDMADIAPSLPDVYKMCAAGDTVGVFQIESRAQMNMLPRLRPEKFYDLVIEVAIVRPGPIQGDMVHPYLRRKSGVELIEYPRPGAGFPQNELEEVLSKTLGVPLFQEQVMKVAMVAAEFTGAEADGLRRAMATFKRVGGMGRFEQKLIDGMTRRGYEPRFADAIFKQIKGFGSYGFPESHAASFAKLVYVSAWLKCRFPAAFCAALLNSQPMGFYAPAQLVRDALEHGVEVRPADVEHSDWDCTLETSEGGEMALRLGLRLIDGLHKELGLHIAKVRGESFGSFDSFIRRTGLTRAQVRCLAQADAFGSFDMNRRGGLWQALKVAPKSAAPLVDAMPRFAAPPPLPLLTLSEEVVADYQTTRLSLKGHPMGFLRDLFTAEKVRPCADLVGMCDKDKATVAGVVLVRQRPGNGNVCFITIEDEEAVANLVVVMPVFEAHRAIIMSSRLLVAHGHVQKSPEGVTHVFVQRLEDCSAELARLTEDGEQAGEVDAMHPPIARADHVRTNGPTGSAGVKIASLKAPDPRSSQALGVASNVRRHPRDVRIISRDFH